MTASSTAILTSELPLRPGTATQVLEALDDPHTSTHDIGAIVNTEPAIAARVIGLANSPIFYRGNEIADISRAMSRVGINAVRAITLGVAMDTLFGDHPGLDPAHWDHAIITAGAAITTAQHTETDHGQAFCTGLMVDIGQIAMAIASPANWTQVLEQTAVNTPERLALETELFNTDHASLGSKIVTGLGLPLQLADAIATHHQPLTHMTTNLGRCLALAATITELAESDTDPTAELDRLLPDLAMDTETLLAQAAEQIDHLRIAFAQ